MTLKRVLSTEELEKIVEQQEKTILDLRFSLVNKNKILTQIKNWELPRVNQYWDEEHKREMSYEACYGSNGARAYIKSIAATALNN